MFRVVYLHYPKCFLQCSNLEKSSQCFFNIEDGTSHDPLLLHDIIKLLFCCHCFDCQPLETEIYYNGNSLAGRSHMLNMKIHP